MFYILPNIIIGGKILYVLYTPMDSDIDTAFEDMEEWNTHNLCI